MKTTRGVILAAGYSSRLGRFKPLLKLGGMSLLERLINTFRRAGVGRIAVVCGHRMEEVAGAAAALGAEPVLNPEFGQGMFSSVRAGLASLDRAAGAAWVLPVDIPLIRAGTLRIMHEVWSAFRPPLIHPTFEGEIGHPPLLDRVVWPSVLEHDGTEGLRGALRPWEPQAMQAASADRNTLLDLDTPQDLSGLEERAGRIGIPDQEESEELAQSVLAMAPNLVAHGRAVARLGLSLAQAMPEAELDMDLIYAGGLLHDLAKGRSRHEDAGAARLIELGLEPVAALVGGHSDMPPPAQGGLGEAELVCLADKCVQETEIVNPNRRYLTKLDLFRHDPRAINAIMRRRGNCRGLVEIWERDSGQKLLEFLARERENG